MPIDRNRESSEAGETQPLSIEQQIEQGRPERDAWRAANWDKIDLNRPEYDREPEPFTLEVLGLTGADNDDDSEPAAAYRSQRTSPKPSWKARALPRSDGKPSPRSEASRPQIPPPRSYANKAITTSNSASPPTSPTTTCSTPTQSGQVSAIGP